jgi:hypothetical protein
MRHAASARADWADAAHREVSRKNYTDGLTDACAPDSGKRN